MFGSSPFIGVAGTRELLNVDECNVPGNSTTTLLFCSARGIVNSFIWRRKTAKINVLIKYNKVVELQKDIVQKHSIFNAKRRNY